MSKIELWKSELKKMDREKQRAVVWGGGSKGVTFLNTLKITDQIEYVIAINPHKHGKYVTGTGQQIVPPETLKDYRPDKVIVMNPAYINEIRQFLLNNNVKADIITA